MHAQLQALDPHTDNHFIERPDKHTLGTQAPLVLALVFLTWLVVICPTVVLSYIESLLIFPSITSCTVCSC